MGYRVLAHARWALRASVRRQSAAGTLSARLGLFLFFYVKNKKSLLYTTNGT